MAKHLKCVTTGIQMFCGLPKAQFNFLAYVNSIEFFAALIQLHDLKVLSFISISILYVTSHNHLSNWYIQFKLNTSYLSLNCYITLNHMNMGIQLAYILYSYEKLRDHF